jgi:Pyruvate/2-oxoacid:ferredoxin oxidoreductase delta subunit
VIFGDIGCNALLYFMDALYTGVAMGAGESKRTGYVLARPEMADKCHACLICPGIEAKEGEFPAFNSLCSGCGEKGQACLQMCPFDAMEPLTEEEMVRISTPGSMNRRQSLRSQWIRTLCLPN